MTDSKEFPVEWAEFPDERTSRDLVRRVKKHALKQELAARPPIPYQFIMPVMAYLYQELLPSVVEKGIPQKMQLNNGSLPINPMAPDNIYDASRAQLRAIAYFSWHGGRRLFATRRVYPTYFDFFSLSFVEEGWGALGELLSAIDKEGVGKVISASNPFIVVKNIHCNHRFLPFLREADRLHYDAALAIPFFDGNESRLGRQKFDRNSLRGAMVFYCSAAECLPSSGLACFSKRVKAFSGELAALIKEHESNEDSGIKQPVTGRKVKHKHTHEYWKNALRHSQDSVVYAEITVEVLQKDKPEDIARQIQSRLSGADFFCMRGDLQKVSGTRENTKTGKQLKFWVTCLKDGKNPLEFGKEKFSEYLDQRIRVAMDEVLPRPIRENIHIKIHG